MEFSKMMLGTVQFGLDYGIANTAGKPSYETARDIIKTAFENGIDSIDTAAGYGDSELVLGRAIAELKLRDRIKVVSKVPDITRLNLSQTEAERFIRQSVETSLVRLGIPKLAACLLHAEHDLRYIRVLEDLEREGLIGGAGISLDSDSYCEAVIASGIRYVQVPCNILDKRFDSFFPFFLKNGTHVFTRSVYLQGLLLMPEDKITESLRDVIPVRRSIESLVGEFGMDISEACIRFVLSNPAVTSILTGVDNSDQLQRNISLFKKGPLPEELYEKIKNTVSILEERIIRPALWNRAK